jgi:hypothetical protein
MKKLMPRHCVFCNSPATTKEHIWPNWAARRISREGPVGHYLNAVEEGQPAADRSWLQKQFTMTVRAVCEACNNGWMAELEGRVKPFFEAALDGQGSVLKPNLQRDLASWALKTLMMVESQQKPAAPVILSDDYPHLYARREPSDRVRTWIAAYSGVVSTAVGHIYALDVSVGEDDLRQGNLWGGTVVFGPVLFHLLGSDLPDLLSSADMDGPGIRQLWPYEEDFTWEPTPALDDEALPGFMDWFLNGLLAGQGVHRARKLP